MELYLKINIPEGKRVRLIEKRTLKVVKGSEFRLYPHKGTEVPNNIGFKLLAQDPHLIAELPAADDPEVAAKVKVDYLVTLQELAEKVLDDLKSKEIIEYGERLGIEIPLSMKREQKVALLEKRCHELAKGME